jgi:prepilin signal peptidase PulO-like enzyme (type II secretory pathway)
LILLGINNAIIKLMEVITVYFALVLFGLCLGSFAGASVWRLRAYQLKQDKADGDNSNKAEYKLIKKIINKAITKDRSRCLHCSYELRWFDLIPIVSWVSLGGKCRKCHKKIGYFEPLIELGVAIFFVISYAFWPYSNNNVLETMRLVIWLISGVGLAILFAYDAKWFLLPDKISFLVILLGIVNSVIVMILAHDKQTAIFSIAGAVFILSGIYWILYQISKGKWIGFGDIKLGLGLALLLSDWRMAFIALFAANLIGCIIVLPAMMAGKLHRTSHVPFGPLLIIGFVIAGLFGQSFLEFYFPVLF